MTRSANTSPAGAATDSAPDTPPVGQPGPSATAPPGGPAAAIVTALTAAPGATAAQLAEAAGITRAAAARELAALEKAGHATLDRNVSPATWTAWNIPGETPGTDSPDSLAGQHHIKDDDVRRRLADPGKRRLTGRSGMHLIAETAQSQLEALPGTRVVLD